MSVDIVGIGAVTTWGRSTADAFEALCRPERALAPLRAFDASRYRAANAYEIDDRVDGEDVPWRATGWLLDAVRDAAADAGLTGEIADCPVLVGTTLREQRSVELWWTGRAAVAEADLHFGRALRKEFGTEQTYTFPNACAATLYTLGMAVDMIEAGMHDTVVVAGTDALCESAFGTLDRVQDPAPDALRPFDRDRAGMLMGEGAVAMVVRRSRPDGRARARVAGVTMSCDAVHPTAPDRGSIVRTIRDAHTAAGVTADAIDLVMLHGSGTVLNDAAESSAVGEVFGAAGAGPLLTAVKSGTGHTLGGSGLLSAIVALHSMAEGRVPPIQGLENPTPEAEGLRLVREPEAADVRRVQVDAFGFGGINAVAILEAAP